MGASFVCIVSFCARDFNGGGGGMRVGLDFLLAQRCWWGCLFGMDVGEILYGRSVVGEVVYLEQILGSILYWHSIVDGVSTYAPIVITGGRTSLFLTSQRMPSRYGGACIFLQNISQKSPQINYLTFLPLMIAALPSPIGAFEKFPKSSMSV